VDAHVQLYERSLRHQGVVVDRRHVVGGDAVDVDVRREGNAAAELPDHFLGPVTDVQDLDAWLDLLHHGVSHLRSDEPGLPQGVQRLHSILYDTLR
jgi:hypothetical protein